jgi:hypothetical protein
MRLAAAALLLAACGASADRPAVERPEAASAPAAPPPPADSLALTMPAGEVWYTLARSGVGADGRKCVDRALEIRRGDTRIPVPLLYTGTAPERVNDSTFRARLSNRCMPADSYLVNLRTGRPTPER